MKNKTNGSFLSRFFSHNVTLLVLAFLLAFAAWFIINITTDSETSVTVSKIPITLELPQSAKDDGLTIFGGDDLTASIDVIGNPIIVGDLTASDITVTTNQTGSVITSGSYTLPLTAKKSGLKTNYNFVEGSLSPSTVTVYVDRQKEETFAIDNQLTVQLNDSSHYANTSLSQNNVIVSGPETHVNQIASVAVIDSISADTETIEEKLVFLDEEGERLELPYVMTDIETVEAAISVLPITTVSLDVNVTNAPDSYPDIIISPPSVKIAGPQKVLDSIEDKTVTIGTMDFTKLTNEGNKQKFDITLPNGCKVVSGETSATASIDLNSYYSTTVTAKVSSKLDSSEYTTEFASNNVEITVNGPEELIDSITASDVTVIADFTGLLDDLKKSGNAISVSVPLKVTLDSDYTECWIYGTYSANVNVTKK